ncbi:hypothetical protein LWI29_034845 [Acer saccharum]|uniref:TRAF-type domain-containing protein n=1 Tax=Acer saccharum TaxID=4024 RepID=A0AA39S915_ACESA|nr:hypothetical protein LWI29_034845 [Acer saccharum]
MDVPPTDVENIPEKIEVEEEEKKGPSFNCDLCDTEIVHKIAQAFLPGIATACVDNTSGDIFKTPGSVAVDIRTAMVDYLTQRSESFVAESVILEGGPEAEVSDHPFDIITDLVDDFAASKRNLFSRVSGWLLSEKREDKIDDFVQEMETSNFWFMDRREAISQTLLRNVDFKNEFHCSMKFNSAEELTEHVRTCGFRSLNCPNEGCSQIFSANQMEEHDTVCPFKIIRCEQNCSDSLMRQEMDRHCITVCPMKLAKCPFYGVGCHSPVPQCMIEQHRSDNLHSHLLYILQSIHKEASVEDLKRRVEQLEKSSSGNLAEARNVRSLTFAVKDLEATLGPLEVTAVSKVSEEGKVDEGEKTSEEGKVNEEKTSEEGKIIEGEKISEEGNVIEGEKTSEEGKVIEGAKISEGGKVTEGGKVSEEGNVNEGGQVSEERKFMVEREVSEEENVSGGGKAEEEEKVTEGGKTGEEEKVTEEVKVNEEKTSEEGKIIEGEKISKEGNVIEGEKTSEEVKDNEEKTSEEGKVIVDGGKISEQSNVNEGQKIDKEVKVSEGGKLGEAGRVGEEGTVGEGGNISEEAKLSGEVNLIEEGKINGGAQVNEMEKPSD